MNKTVDSIIGIMSKHWKLVALFAMALTLAIAMLQSVGRSVWFDEGYSIMVAQQPIPDLIRLTSVDAHPPVFYLLLKAWGALFGWSELSLRLSSALTGALTVGVMIALVRKLFSPKTAIVAAPFLVLAPFLARYNYEIRMYALVALIGAVATWVLVTAVKTKATKWWIAYALLVALGMYTLYMSVVFWLAHVVWLAWQSRRDGKPIIRQKYWLWYGLAVVLFLPWAPTVVYQLLHSALPPYMSAVTITELVNVVTMYMGYSAFWQTGAWLSVGIFIAVVSFFVIFARVWRMASKKYRSGILLLIFCFVVGIAFYAVISLPPSMPRFIERYAMHIAPYFYALIGVMVAFGWRMGNRVPVVLLAASSLAVLVYGQVALMQAGNFNFQRLQSVQAKSIRHEVGCDQTTFITSGPYGYIDSWYDMRGCDLKFYYPWDTALTGGYAPLDKSDKRITSTKGIDSKRIVFIYYNDSTDFMAPDGRYKKIGTQDIDQTHLILYER